MLYPRIIPCLLVKNKGLVKTRKFKDPKYIGDPINTVKIFNEKEVDELVVLDIEASKNNINPDYNMIKNLAVECRMPLCYGGGIKTAEQANKIFSLGVEKIALNSGAIASPSIITEISKNVGSQSVVVVLDVRKKLFSKNYEIWVDSHSTNTKINPIEVIDKIKDLGVGEIVINSIDNDGMMNGYDLEFIAKVKEKTNLPLTALGGAGSIDDIKKLISHYGTIGCGVGSLFVFNGKYRAVLVTYPSIEEKEEIIKSSQIKE